MLVAATIRTRARSLINEPIEGYFQDTEFNNWIADAAIDISTKTNCYIVEYNVPQTANIEMYLLPLDTLKVVGATFDNVGLDRITVSMKGKQTAVPSGLPRFFYEIIGYIGFNPIPSGAETGKIATTYLATVTSTIANIPSKFQTPAILFVSSMALLKIKQYDKATQLYNLYLSSLGLDRQDIVVPQLETPPALSSHVVKTFEAPNRG